ncbi:MAG TPA: fused MFS/spermidine synthase [Gemmatimonadales bacterium]|jgi:precorrin-6B methylase 2|nr:fused MFS/spermidine synthase [Gemmatimonadales bacterium]
MNAARVRPQLTLILIGVASGVAAQLDWWAARGRFQAFDRPAYPLFLLRTALLATAALFGLRAGVRWLVGRLPLPRTLLGEYRKHDSLTYAPILLLWAGVVGIQLSIPFLYLLGLTFLIAQGLLLLLLLGKNVEQPRFFLSLGWLSVLFLLSGFAALMYQVVWQRLLFAAYGVNIESVTIIVSIFMFGLGVGSLAGGLLSRRYPERLPHLFVVCELAIGAFGLVSVPLIEGITDLTVNGSLLGISLVTYAVLFVPTLFMGATLPILVTHLNRYHRHVGRSVGILYCFNTVGSAIASLVTVDVLFALTGRQATVIVAALLNLTVAFLVFRYCRGVAAAGRAEPASQATPEPGPVAPIHAIAYPLALVLAAATGYVSLSQEIVWVRVLSFANGNMPHAFGHVLGFFLFGIAGGALVGKRVAETPGVRPLVFIAWMFLAAALFYYACIPTTGLLIAAFPILGILVSYLTVAVTAFLLGSVFPVLCHFGIRATGAVGLSLAGIYVANIIGSTAGPLVTGFVLMNRQSLDQIVLVLSSVSLALAAGLGLLVARGVRGRAPVLGGALAAAALGFLGHGPAYRGLLEHLLFQGDRRGKPAFKYVVQNRSGIIAVVPDEGGDIVYGGGVYDGRFGVDPVTDSNRITRAFMIAGLHPNPEEVLEIGLSSGSWTWVVAAHAGVRTVDAVEINPGYLELIEHYPEHRTILSNPKVRIHIDDGRRWLKRHPEARFDFILMNTSFHWSSNITNLLSREFLTLLRGHLKEGGVVYYNATGSDDVLRTAAAVFRHVTTYDNFVAASDRPFAMSADERRANLLKFQENGHALLDPGQSGTRLVLDNLATAAVPDQAPQLLGRAELRVITEDNMLTEYKRMDDAYQQVWLRLAPLYQWRDPERAWSRFSSASRPDSPLSPWASR